MAGCIITLSEGVRSIMGQITVEKNEPPDKLKDFLDRAAAMGVKIIAQ